MAIHPLLTLHLEAGVFSLNSDKKRLPDKSLKALLMNNWLTLTLDSYELIAYVENFHNDYLKVCLSYNGKRLKPEQKGDLLDHFFQAVNKIAPENS